MPRKERTTPARARSGDASPRSGEVSRLRARLVEAEQTLEAIRNGSVDALVVSTAEGDKIYALRSVDRSYRRIIESVHEGAATLTHDGTVFYANQYLADLLERPLELVIGHPFGAWLEDPDAFAAALTRLDASGVHQEARLRSSSGRAVPVYLALSRFEDEEGPGVALVVSDLR